MEPRAVPLYPAECGDELLYRIWEVQEACQRLVAPDEPIPNRVETAAYLRSNPATERRWYWTVGDWEPGHWMPGGVEEIRAYVRERGLLFGLWMEAECVGSQSRIVTAARFPALQPDQDRHHDQSSHGDSDTEAACFRARAQRQRSNCHDADDKSKSEQ